jgi:anion-transporting  ArsA/GET3 family ATPase
MMDKSIKEFIEKMAEFSKDSEKQLKDIKDMEGNFMKIVSKHKDKEDILKKIETIKKMDISQLNEFVNAHRRNQ